MSAPAVPYCRPIRRLTAGDDVKADKRALSRAGFMQWPPPGEDFTPIWGDFAIAGMQEFQVVHGIEPVTGLVGPPTAEALRAARRKGHPTEWAYDATALRLMREFCAGFEETPEERIRAAIAASGWYWYGHHAAIAYSQARPFPVVRPPVVPSRFDCSGFVTQCHYSGGAPNPNGRPWDGLGYTGTLITRGRRVDPSQLKVGDLAFYGFSAGGPGFRPGDPTHVALVVKTAPMMVLSMGHYPMGYYPIFYRYVTRERPRGDFNHGRTYDVTP